MQVILLKDIENIGKKYDIKEVSDGYARNRLLPEKLAKIATPEELKKLGAEKKKNAKKAEDDLSKVQELVGKIDGTDIALSMKVSKEGRLFESVNTATIVAELKKQGFDIKKSQVDLAKPIKEIGEYNIRLEFDYGLEAEVHLSITEIPTESKE